MTMKKKESMVSEFFSFVIVFMLFVMSFISWFLSFLNIERNILILRMMKVASIIQKWLNHKWTEPWRKDVESFKYSTSNHDFSLNPLMTTPFKHCHSAVYQALICNHRRFKILDHLISEFCQQFYFLTKRLLHTLKSQDHASAAQHVFSCMNDHIQ